MARYKFHGEVFYEDLTLDLIPSDTNSKRLDSSWISQQNSISTIDLRWAQFGGCDGEIDVVKRRL